MIGGRRIATGVSCVGVALMLGACSLESSALSTGTLLGAGKQKEPTPAELATDRAVHVAATSANASRCGYVFDPAQVKASYLAFEQGQGAAADFAQQLDKSYDFTHAKIAKSTVNAEDFCSEEQTAIIKRNLNKVLAGDFSAPAKARDVSHIGPTVAPMDREKIFHPIR
ncbi:MAG: hypothetical protein SFW09_00020 [Hyphomicrobiaceae bacterium]|nr:hypothetical protein [Hyphomicrobiaceae bacterium]